MVLFIKHIIMFMSYDDLMVAHKHVFMLHNFSSKCMFIVLY